ncbi:MAG: terminase family protein [Verrucomicrobia bacterium]|nr:terminase family protein [Verrucomicrobiota bacterium]
MNERVIWKPTPKQAEFLSCPAREVLYGGSAGSGKSDSLLMAALSQVQNPLHRALIVRKTFPMLRDLIGRSHELYLPLGATYSKAEKTWTFPSGALVEFGYLDADEDKYNYQGRQFSSLCWDELTQWPGDGTDANGEPVNSAYLYLLSRLRSPEGSGLRHEVRATCNPGGPGHNWVKQRWNIPDDGSASERRDPITNYRRVFIPARLKDNPFLAQTDYARGLEALAEADRKTLAEGRWDVYAGAVFSEWNFKLHTCQPFPIPDGLEMWRGADDGWASPACVLWALHDEIHDRIFIVNELYRAGMTAQVMAQAVLAIDSLYDDEPLDGIIDSASFADTGMGGGRANVMNALGCRWRPSEKGVGSRIAGKNAIHSRLALRSDGFPGLIVFRTCKNTIRTLPALPYSRSNPEDVDSSADDHCYDAARYLLGRKPPAKFARVRLKGL